MLEGVARLESLLREAPIEHVLFGSNAPLFYLEAAALKLKESPSPMPSSPPSGAKTSGA